MQARSGGHSYANYSLGGIDGAVVVDLKHFQQFSMDQTTWRATVGAGTLLGYLTVRMYQADRRAMAHGTCPQVGIGGHATIGGLGPSSRLFGAALDHIEEVEVVTADGTIKRASSGQNADLFWALKGAGASFGIITEFVVKTEEAPGEAVQFSFSFTRGSYASMTDLFKAWQTFISDPKLDRRFASEVIISVFGMAISGTFFGSPEEYEKLELSAKFPGNQSTNTIHFKDWFGLLGHWADQAAQRNGGGVAAPFYTKTLTFGENSPVPDHVIDNVFQYLDKTEKGTLIWFMIFDLAGGAINDVPHDSTAYAHRDALFYLPSYAIDLGGVSEKTRNFLRGVKETFADGMPGVDFGAYPGYVDPELENGSCITGARICPGLSV